MSFERVKSVCRTLRFRLTLWNTVLILVMLLVNLLAVREGVRWSLSRMTDAFLQEELVLALEDVSRLAGRPDELRDELNRQALSHTRRRLFIQLLDPGGGVAWESDHSPPRADLPPAAVAFDEPVTVADYRFVCRDSSVPGLGIQTVRVGCSLERTRSEVRHFSGILMQVAVVLLLAAPAGGFLLAGRATRPIADIISTTERLNPTHLHERLPIRGTRDELDRLSQTINRFLDRIATYLRQSCEFTANAAHELRSPLFALQSSLEITLNTDRTPEEYKEVLSVLLEECGQMRLLVNQLLLLAEADAGRLVPHPLPVRLDQIVGNSLEMFRAVAEVAGVELAARGLEPVVVRGDGTRLWQVANNLIDNAIKFTPAGGRVVLTLSLEGTGTDCVLEVADTGSGIAAEDLPNVFDRFFQGDKARDREAPRRGVGLGLSICRVVVAAHGGTIEVASPSSRGTTVTVRLPRCVRPGSDSAADRAELP